MKLLKLISLVGLSIYLLGCDTAEYETIQGDWHCSSWIVTATGAQQCRGDVRFSFSTEKTYTSDIGSIHQQGKFDIINDQITFYPEGSMAIGVKVDQLNMDTLAFTMNRAGSEEKMILVRPTTSE